MTITLDSVKSKFTCELPLAHCRGEALVRGLDGIDLKFDLFVCF